MARKVFKVLLLSFLSAASAACAPDRQGAAEQASVAAVQLGRTIFSDASLSADRGLACATCHRTDYAFAQPTPVPAVYQGRVGTRNVPSLMDLPYVTHFFWDGRESELDKAVVAAFTNPAEMGQPTMQAVVDAIARNPAYAPLVDAAYGGRVDEHRIAAALTAYLDDSPTGRSKFDESAGGKRPGLTDAEQRGLAVFDGKGECSSCHRMTGAPMAFTDNGFHHSNVGLERISGNVAQTLNDFKAAIAQGTALSELVLSNPDFAALGRLAVTGQAGDLSAYRTPTLRNVTRTAPYMHDGSVRTLEEAVQREIYYRSLARGNPISLTAEEQRDLISFLRTLEDR